MSVLLAQDVIALVPPDGTDGHGWREPGAEAVWTGKGNLQLQPGISDPRASDGGGRGPFGPARDEVGQVYLPPEAPVAEGMVALARGRVYVLSQTRPVLDPSGDGTATCWVATVRSVDTWPDSPVGPGGPQAVAAEHNSVGGADALDR